MEPRMVCVNGAQQSMAVWRSFIGRFVGQHTIVTFDMPGLGRSRALTGTLVTTLDEQVNILGAVINATVVVRRPLPSSAAPGVRSRRQHMLPGTRRRSPS